MPGPGSGQDGVYGYLPAYVSALQMLLLSGSNLFPPVVKVSEPGFDPAALPWPLGLFACDAPFCFGRLGVWSGCDFR